MTLDAHDKAAVLASALPWLERLRGATVVVNFGGNAMVDDALTRAFAEERPVAPSGHSHPDAASAHCER